MAKFSGNSLSVPASFANAIVRWKRAQFPAMMREVHANLTGRMMKRRTGKTLANVISHSRETLLGFKVATTSISLIAWMTGAQRKGYFVRPKGMRTVRSVRRGGVTTLVAVTRSRGAKALRWEKGGRVFFSRGHFIRPWKFSPQRPVIEDAFNRRERHMVAAYEREAKIALNEVFPNTKVQMVINL